FTNEEGARFSPPLLGSGGLSEQFTKEFIYSRTDANKNTFEEELKRIGYQGCKKNRINNIGSYLELHIEQGPILERNGLDIGVVTGIQGMSWMEVKITGKSDHAGSTPMNMRTDALQIATKLIQKITDFVVEYDNKALITIGRFIAYPNSINSIPSEVIFSMDIRHSNDTIKEYLTNIVMEKLNGMACAENASIEINKIWNAESVDFSDCLIQTISKNAKDLGYSNQKIV